MAQYTTAARTYGALAVAYYCADRYAATPYIPTGLIALVTQQKLSLGAKKARGGVLRAWLWGRGVGYFTRTLVALLP